jgi:indoleamine 2,3-dioxygenase
LTNKQQRLPPSIAVPFLDVANHLELPTTATYAGLNLWNFKTLSSTADLTDLDNLRVLNTFTGTEDEEWFYLVSAAIEARGAQSIPQMLHAMDAVRINNAEVVCEALVQLSRTIIDIGHILRRMYEKCTPDVFYNDIRPFLAGSKSMVAAGLPNGVFYDEGDGKGQWRQYSGGSNAQSSLIQFFDVILGVKHLPTDGLKGGKDGFLKVSKLES